MNMMKMRMSTSAEQMKKNLMGIRDISLQYSILQFCMKCVTEYLGACLSRLVEQNLIT